MGMGERERERKTLKVEEKDVVYKPGVKLEIHALISLTVRFLRLTHGSVKNGP